MICTIIGGGPGVNKIDSFKGFKIGLNYTYQYVDVDITVMYDNPDTEINKNLNPPNLHTLIHWKGDVLYNNQHRGINYNKGYVGTCNSSAIMAVNVAIQLGYTTIYLVGCENRVDKYHHFFDTEPIGADEKKRITHVFNNTFKPMWNEVVLERGERLIFVDSAIDRFENITIDEYKKKG